MVRLLLSGDEELRWLVLMIGKTFRLCGLLHLALLRHGLDRRRDAFQEQPVVQPLQMFAS